MLQDEKICSIRWILVNLIYDFCGSAQIYRDYKSQPRFNPFSDMESLSVVRVCQTSSIISLSRLWELLNHYGKEVSSTPDPLRSNLIDLRKKLEEKKVYGFRNKYIGHIIDKDTNAPIKVEDGYPLLQKIVGKDWDEFYQWIFPGPAQDSSNSVVGVVTSFRDYCNELLGDDIERP